MKLLTDLTPQRHGRAADKLGVLRRTSSRSTARVIDTVIVANHRFRRPVS